MIKTEDLVITSQFESANGWVGSPSRSVITCSSPKSEKMDAVTPLFTASTKTMLFDRAYWSNANSCSLGSSTVTIMAVNGFPVP